MGSATRRGALMGVAGLSAGLSFLAAPALAAAGPDANLLALKARWDAVDAEAVKITEAAAQLHDSTVLPARPAALTVRPGDRDLGIDRYANWRGAPTGWYRVEHRTSKTQGLRRRFYRDECRIAAAEDAAPTGEEIWRRVPWPEAQARADEIVAAHDNWLAEIEAAYEASGYNAAHRRLDVVLGQQGALERELQATVPRTLAGLAALADFALRYQANGDDDGLLGGMLARAIQAVAKVEGLSCA